MIVRNVFIIISSSAPFLAATLINKLRFKDANFPEQEKTAATKAVLEFLRSVYESATRIVSATAAASWTDSV